MNKSMRGYDESAFVDLVGQSDAVSQLKTKISQVAPACANVLLLGESGTGKEVVALAIHALSDRADKPFVPINCGAIPKDLLESELFGHEKGAFTGAISQHKGRFELAKGGTIFLDEIGDMPLDMQVKLLRVIQERKFERIGSNNSIDADVRIVAATHRNLEQAIKENTFREDLFYRLNVFPIHIAALRERHEDVSELVNHLVKRMRETYQSSVTFSDNAIAMLQSYDWPGNIRELSNLVERMMVMFPNGRVGKEEMLTHGGIAFSHSAPTNQHSSLENTNDMASDQSRFMTLKERLEETELHIIKQGLIECGGVITKTAKYLGLGRTTLIEKIKKHELNTLHIKKAIRQ